jgi:hypothetical protein
MAAKQIFVGPCFMEILGVCHMEYLEDEKWPNFSGTKCICQSLESKISGWSNASSFQSQRNASSTSDWLVAWNIYIMFSPFHFFPP